MDESTPSRRALSLRHHSSTLHHHQSNNLLLDNHNNDSYNCINKRSSDISLNSAGVESEYK